MQQIKVVKKTEKAVNASPSKNFFVEMLTRDIELKDAILDLLDNCLDGVVRSLGSNKKQNPIVPAQDGKPYKGYSAAIEFNEKVFRISDNCGGMSREILEKYAFRLGRPALDRDKDIPTVGLYGIGMKRAIFKMGGACTVVTRNDSSAYRVRITPQWLADDDEWHLDIEEIDPRSAKIGTTIEISYLREGVAAEFDRDKNTEFADDLRTLISTHYSYIIHKGFSVKVNEKPIRPREVHLRYSVEDAGKAKIAPFMFTGKIEDVDVELVVGLYRDVPDAAELDAMDAGGGFRKENAGWTVICNDRVVVLNDTSYITGWGEGQVPKYHSQFIAISGLVRLSSSNPASLPLTTTKRGINLNSPLYAEVKNIMREGLRHFTSFTNRWKTETNERKEIYERTYPIEPLKALKTVPSKEWSTSRKYGGRIFVPVLPIPSESKESKKNIRFSKQQSEVLKLALFLFQDSSVSPSVVGERCFDDYLKLAESES